MRGRLVVTLAPSTWRWVEVVHRAALAGALLLAARLVTAESPRPSLLLFTVDTARADHLSLYGYPRATTPRLDALDRSGVFFESVISPIPQTGPACAALLTGRWPASLGVHSNEQRLGAGPRTLGQVLGEVGYATAAFVSGLPLQRQIAGLDRGFTHFDDELPDPRGAYPRVQRRGDRTTAAALTWIGARPKDRPFFLWVHYYDPHGDYNPPKPFVAMFLSGSKGPMLNRDLIPDYQRYGGSNDAAGYIARYDGELRFVDTEIGKLLDGLDAGGLLKGTLVAVIGDHGENLVEHGYYFDHGNELYMEAVHVPLVIAGPGVPADGRRVRGVVRTPDVMPTLLELLGVGAPNETEGRSLVSALGSGSVVGPREATSEARLEAARPLTPFSDVTPKLAVRDDHFTVLWREATWKLELYDRAADPGEMRDLLAGRPLDREADELRTALRGRMQARLAALTRGAMAETQVIGPDVAVLASRRQGPWR